MRRKNKNTQYDRVRFPGRSRGHISQCIYVKRNKPHKSPTKNVQNAALGSKHKWRHERVSRQEKLLADILRSEATGMPKRMRESVDKENLERERRKRIEERRKMSTEQENGNRAHNPADRRAKWPAYRGQS